MNPQSLTQLNNFIFPYTRDENIDSYKYFVPPCIILEYSPVDYSFVDNLIYTSVDIVPTLTKIYKEIFSKNNKDNIAEQNKIGICISDIHNSPKYASELAAGYAKMLASLQTSHQIYSSVFIAFDKSIINTDGLYNFVKNSDIFFIAYDDTNEDYTEFRITKTGRLNYNGSIPDFILELNKTWCNVYWYEHYSKEAISTISQIVPMIGQNHIIRSFIDTRKDENIIDVLSIIRKIITILSFGILELTMFDYNQDTEKEKLKKLQDKYKWFTDNVHYSQLANIDMEDPFKQNIHNIEATSVIWNSVLKKLSLTIDLEKLLDEPKLIQNMGKENGIDFLFESVLAGVPMEDIL